VSQKLLKRKSQNQRKREAGKDERKRSQLNLKKRSKWIPKTGS
jgi:hypothetical protein